MTKKTLSEMTEQERALYYEEHRDDPELWQGPARRFRLRRGHGPSTVFSVRLTPEELDEIARAAETEQTSVSDFIRTTALERARGVASR